MAVTLHLREAPWAVYGAIREYFLTRRYAFRWGVEPEALVFERGSVLGTVLAVSTRHVQTRLEILIREEVEGPGVTAGEGGAGQVIRVECHYSFPDWILATPALLLLPLHLVRLHEEVNRLETYLLQNRWRRGARAE